MADVIEIPAVIVKDGLVRFNGDCEQCRPYCAAHCCKQPIINLLPEEAKSGDYKVDTEMYPGDSSYYRMVLKKKKVNWSPYDMCYYLDEDYKCTIYDNRPFGCREFTCKDKSIHLRQFRGFTDFSKVIEYGKKGELKLITTTSDDIPPMDPMGIVWTMFGEFGISESAIMELLDTVNEDIPIGKIKEELSTLFGNMSTAVHTMEEEFVRRFRDMDENNLKEKEKKDEEES